MKGNMYLLSVLVVAILRPTVFASNEQEVFDVFREIMTEANWYERENSNFYKNLVNTEFEYEIYRESFEEEKIGGVIGVYYFLIVKKGGIFNPEFDSHRETKILGTRVRPRIPGFVRPNGVSLVSQV